MNVKGLKYLNAVINESLRLTHSAPETTRRITGPDGNRICREHIPAGACCDSLSQITPYLLTQSLDLSWGVLLCNRTLSPSLERRQVLQSRRLAWAMESTKEKILVLLVPLF